ncbi:luciferase-like protein [Rhizocola hellebori]|uniref:Luciferase-like protein n=1 Tax=Rhizocola hellebori TaxID=1392758 RepID=A0A8J3VDE8_9ACTN|nr:LLM class flavin-dependent oxidoreductase [Rhizocola hellebori]GIH02396.1 luciferase-like protein [Rhizocola hellebori]
MLRLEFQPWGETMAELIDATRRAEAAGAVAAWAPELHRNALVTATAIASQTNLLVGTGISLAFATSPMLTALAAMDLDDLSGGRFRLGLGSGVRRLNADWHGAAFDPPVKRLRETIAVIRKVWAGGDPILHDGTAVSIDVRGWRRPYAGGATPIYLAGVGPAMVALAGEVADGWLSHELCPPSVLRESVLPALGRSGRRVDVVVSACCSVDASSAVARRRAAGVVGFYASVSSYASLFAAAGFAAEQEAVVAARRTGIPADRLGHLVPDEMAAAFTLCGTSQEVALAVKAYDGLADAVKLSAPTHGLAPDEIRAAQDSLIELIRELS